VVTSENDATTARELRSFMLNTRYWWLEGAPTDSIRCGIDEVFAKYDVETIAPAYDCILSGRKVVARHVRMLDESLKELGRSVAVAGFLCRDEGGRCDGRQDAARAGGWRVLDRGLAGAALEGQGLSRLQCRVPGRR